MSKNYPNFYETLNEAQYRLMNTVVLYDKEPYRVILITSAHPDKIFRVYLLPLSWTGDWPDYSMYPNGSKEQMDYMDKWIEGTPKAGMLRKHINSPLFNKFRPFPLGMMNKEGKIYYLERMPVRHREQGLTRNSVSILPVTLEIRNQAQVGGYHEIFGKSMRDCILGLHPSLDECLKELKDPLTLNAGAAFHRECAVLKGPLDMFFLNVRGKTVGLIESKEATLAHEFRHLKELVENTNQFHRVTVKEKKE